MHNYKVVEYFLPDSDDVLCDSTRWVDHGGYEITLMSVPRQGEGESCLSHIKVKVSHVCPTSRWRCVMSVPRQGEGESCLAHIKVKVSHVCPTSRWRWVMSGPRQGEGESCLAHVKVKVRLDHWQLTYGQNAWNDVRCSNKMG